MSVARCAASSSLGLLCMAGLAGCGASSARRQAPVSQRCPAKLARALGSRVSGRAIRAEPGLRTCLYASRSARVRVTLDDLPQAWRRWDRAQVERTQTAVEWSDHPSQQPQSVSGIGAGAFWVRQPRELVASDGRRLLTVRVLIPARAGRARRVAIRIAPAGLGPPRVPEASGP